MNRIVISYENHGGGVNNLNVAYDFATKLTATSLKDKESAVRGLKMKIRRKQSNA